MTERDQIAMEDLVRRARQRDKAAFEALVLPLQARLEAQVRARVGRRVRAQVEPEDVVQQALLKAFVSIGRLEWRGEEAFYSWLSSIAEHLIWKATQRAAPSHLSMDEEPSADASPPLLALTREERARRLEKALEDLSTEHLEVILLTRIEGLRIDEVAGRMGRSPNAVKKLLARALEALRRRFGDTTGSLRLPARPLEIGGPGRAD